MLKYVDAIRIFHPRRSFRCRSRLQCDNIREEGDAGCAGGRPIISTKIISAAGIENAVVYLTPPQTIISLTVETAVCLDRDRGRAVVLVAVQLSVPGSYLPPVLKRLPLFKPAPDDHSAAGPHCRVIDSRVGRVGGAGGCPTISARVISAAGIKNVGMSIRPRRSFSCRSTPRCVVKTQGAPVSLAAVQLSVLGLYLPPVFKLLALISPPPRQSFRCRSRPRCDNSAEGALVVRAVSNYRCWDNICRRCSNW